MTGATIGNSRSSRGPGIAGGVALLLLATFWIATVVGTGDQARQPPLRLELRLRRLFEANAPGIRVLALPTNAVLHTLGQQQGSDRVIAVRSRLQGRVLLLSDELEFERGQPVARPIYAQNVAAIRSRIEALRAAGVVRIVLLPVPTKAAVLAQADPSVAADACAALSGRSGAAALRPPPTCDGSVTAAAYRLFADAFASGPNVKVVALQDLFVSETRRGAIVYVYEDTHWTSFGMTMAAREALRTWVGVTEPIRVGTLPDQPGDLQRMLALPDRSSMRTHPLAEERYDLTAAVAPCASTVFLLGSSYSRHGQGLATLLERGSGCRVVDLAVAGREADTSFGPLFQEHRGELPGAVVIWEFPFRSLLFPGAFTRLDPR